MYLTVCPLRGSSLENAFNPGMIKTNDKTAWWNKDWFVSFLLSPSIAEFLYLLGLADSDLSGHQGYRVMKCLPTPVLL